MLPPFASARLTPALQPVLFSLIGREALAFYEMTTAATQHRARRLLDLRRFEDFGRALPVGVAGRSHRHAGLGKDHTFARA